LKFEKHVDHEIMLIPGEDYSIGASCALNLISAIVFFEKLFEHIVLLNKENSL